MGGVCTTPKIDDLDEFVRSGKDSHAKAVLRKTPAKELAVIPGTEVVIIGSGGEEAPVRVGQFVLLKLEGERQLTVIFVGESLEDQEGFYYPVLPETPVLLSGGRVLTVHAGEGDIFGIRLPKDLPGGNEQLLDLVDVLSKECALQVQQEPDMADKVVGHIAKGGKKLVSGVELVTSYMSKGIRKGGDLARSKLGQKQEVKFSETTKATVASARFATGGAVVIAGTVVDGLMETAAMLGREAVKRGSGGNSGGRESSVLRVGKAAGVAGAEVFLTLVKAGDILLQETFDETSAVVGHRYGQDAAELTKDGLGIAADVKSIGTIFGRKALPKLAAKAALYTAKGMTEGAGGDCQNTTATRTATLR